MLDTREEKEELSLVILVENELDAVSKEVVLVEKEALAATRLEAVVSVLVVLVEKDPEAVTRLEAVVSTLVSLVEIEPDPR
jgi:hypothetical protein